MSTQSEVYLDAPASDAQGLSIAAVPRPGQKILHGGRKYTTIKEGLGYILVPEDTPLSVDPKSSEARGQSVFYNPVQQFNRDLSVLAIRAYAEDLVALKEEKLRQRAGRAGGKRAKHINNARRKDEGREAVVKSVKQMPAGANQQAAKREHEARSDIDDVQHEAGSTRKRVRTAVDSSAQLLNDKGLIEPVENHSNLPNQLEQATMFLAANDKPGFIGEQFDLEADVETNSALQPEVHKIGSTHSAGEINQYRKPKIKILDALSATGLRALRYAQEILLPVSITANDLSHQATESIKLNVKHNRLESKIDIVTGNAAAHMYSFSGHHEEVVPAPLRKYDVIDLDPYGTAVPFLDAAMQAINDGGLLCVTCTDSGVFASVGYPEKTYALYGGTPIKGLHSHEGGLRLILHAIATTAARYGIAIEPLMSLSIDFYARVFVRVSRSPAEVKLLAGKTMLVYNCDSGCGAWQTQFLARNQKVETKDGLSTYKHSLGQGPTSKPHCEHCGFKTHVSGPMWGGPLHNPAFLERIIGCLPELDEATYATKARMEGMLKTALEESLVGEKPNAEAAAAAAEAEADDRPARPVPRQDPAAVDSHPFYFVPNALAKVIHCRSPPESALRGALRHAGYTATRSHAKAGTIRTDAPWTFVWDMMRHWTKQKAPIKDGALKPGTAGWTVMGRHRDANETKSSMTGTASNLDDNNDNRSPIVFDEALGREVGGKQRLVRYQNNPRPNWGPMSRAKGAR